MLENNQEVNRGIKSGNSSSIKGVIIGRVDSVILDDPKNLGLITYTPLFGNSSGDNKARPLNVNFKQFPVEDEIVAIITGPSYNLNESSTAQSKYYFSPFALWVNTHHNKFPNLITYGNKAKKTTPTRRDIEQGISIPQSKSATRPTTDIAEKDSVLSLKPFLGDIIMESRWGSSIRFGSTSKPGTTNPWSKSGTEGDPITIITNGHPSGSGDPFVLLVEDVNTDKSSIWLTTTQEIEIQDIKDNFSLESFYTQPNVSQDTLLSIPVLPTSYNTISRKEQDRRNNQ